MSRRVIATGRRVHLPVRMLLAAIWLFPLGGAFIAFLSTPWRRVVDKVVADAGHHDRSDKQGPAPEDLAHAAGGAPFSVVDHLQWGHELPVLDWQALDLWAQGGEASPASDEQRVAALEAGRRAWLLHLGEALGPQMGLLTTDEAFVLSPLTAREARATAEYVRTARVRIERLLGSPGELLLQASETWCWYSTVKTTTTAMFRSTTRTASSPPPAACSSTPAALTLSSCAPTWAPSNRSSRTS